jgi:predicted dienelactone hydrolase
MRGLALLLVLGCSESKTADTGSATDGSLAESESDSNGNPDAWVWHPANAVGPHAAGTAESEMVGRTGETLKVQVWYPTDENSSMLHQYDGFMVYGALDTPDPLCDRTRPVVVFSHGNQGMRWQSAFIAERLASHGFLVVAPDHTGNTTFDYSRDRMPEMVFRRPFDVIDSADWLFGAGGVELGLTDCVDESDGYAVSGHSFGGYTATAVGGAHSILRPRSRFAMRQAVGCAMSFRPMWPRTPMRPQWTSATIGSGLPFPWLRRASRCWVRVRRMLRFHFWSWALNWTA